MAFWDKPDPPNPSAVAGAQTSTNIGTALANATLGNVNQVTPSGSLTYNISGYSPYTDPSTGAAYNIPQYTATQSLTPAQQDIFNQQQQTQFNIAGIGNAASTRLGGQLANPLSQSSLTAAGLQPMGDPNALANAPQAQGTIGGSVPGPTYGLGGDPGQISQQFGAAPDVQQSFGNYAGERQTFEDALMSRLNPSLAIERNKYEQQLADQGIRYGSPAYENAMRNYSMQADDARLAAIAQSGQEQQRQAAIAQAQGEFGNKAQQQIFEQARLRGEFGNDAQNQAYQQLIARSQLFNAAQQQQFGQEAQRSQFANSALAQNFAQAQSAFNARNAARSQGLNEIFSLRNQPINEITALLSGSQVTQPNFINANMPTIPTTDVAGIMNKNFDQQLAVSAQQNATMNNIIGGLFGLGGSLGGGSIARSDRDVKQDIHRMGSVYAMNDEGDDRKLPIYSYSFKDDPERRQHVGPMAQDVEKLDKRAVLDIDGVKHIDLNRMGGLLRAA
jgi:endosialidase-like protein